MKISECVRVQHWYHFFRRNKTKLSVSLCLCLSLLCHCLFHCCCRHCWLARSSFENRWDRNAPNGHLSYFISFPGQTFAWEVHQVTHVLYTMVCYPLTFQNLEHLNLYEHKFSITNLHATSMRWLLKPWSNWNQVIGKASSIKSKPHLTRQELQMHHIQKWILKKTEESSTQTQTRLGKTDTEEKTAITPTTQPIKHPVTKSLRLDQKTKDPPIWPPTSTDFSPNKKK